MPSTFLAPALNASFDNNFAIAAAQVEDQNTSKYGPLGERQFPGAGSPWQRAVQIFNNSLTKDETKKFSLESCPKASLESFVLQVSTAKQTAMRKRSKVLDRVNDIAVRINLFSKPMDTFSQANQELMFAWGTMKFLMQVVMSEKEISDKLAEAIADVVQIFGRCEQYTQLFSSHDRLIESIGVLYADVLNLLIRATRFYEKGGIKRFMSSTVTPFEIKFAPIIAHIQNHGAAVESEASMAHRKEQKAENDLQRSFRATIEAQQTSMISREARLWLQASNSENDLRKLRNARTTNTCTWLLRKEQYISWATSTQSNIFWIYGIPGSGKSILASYIIDNILLDHGGSDSKVPVVYFFCSGRNENQKTSVHILRSLIFQLQVQHSDLGDLVAEAYRSSTTGVANSFDELWLLFKSMCEKISVICFIDGLDECQGRDEDDNLDRSVFAHNLLKLAEHRSNSAIDSYFKVLLTSRNEPDLRIAFQSASDIVQTLGISTRDVSDDIHSFIINRINQSDILSHIPDSMKINIIARLDENASGMFIWARLMIEQLETTESDEALEKALETLPTGLSALYDRIMDSIAHSFERNDSIRDLGCFILCWAVHGSRPLTLTELSEARCIVLNNSFLSMRKKPRTLAGFRRLIEAACSPLVEVQDDGLVQLAHHTTKEYLLCSSERLFDICNPNKTFGVSVSSGIDIDYILANVCLSYLRLEHFELPLLGIRKRFALKPTSDVRLAHPLLEYAASNWLFHVNRTNYPPYSIIHEFIRSPQAITWIEAAITVHGGVEKLATAIEYLPTFSKATTAVVTLGDDCGAVTAWFESLQRVIFDWSGTLNQTPSEIHFLDVLRSTGQCPQSTRTLLQKFTLLEDPTTVLPSVRPLGEGASFLLCQPHVYVLNQRSFPGSPFLKRYHWLSMQSMGELLYPRADGFMSSIAEIQICPNERFISAVVVGAPKIMVAVWILSEEGFDPLPWAEEGGLIGSISTELNNFTFSHRPTFEGPGWRRSGRYIAFSEDGKTIRTPAGVFDLASGNKSDVPKACSDFDVTHATWNLNGQSLACIRGKRALEVYESTGRLIATFQGENIKGSMIVDYSKSGRYVLLLHLDTWQHFVYDVHLSSFSIIPSPAFAANPSELKLPTYNENWSIVSHSFSPCERYFSFLVDDLNHVQAVVLGIWDRQAKEWAFAQIWGGSSAGGGLRPSHVQFESTRSGTLHVLVNNGNHPTMGGTRGFIQIDLADKNSFDALRDSNKLDSLSRCDICPNGTGGRVLQRMMYTVKTVDGFNKMVDMIVWNLGKAPPDVECRFTVPNDSIIPEGWRTGYSQSNGAYGDWYTVAEDFSMFIVGGRLYSMTDRTSKSPKLMATFDPASAWKILSEDFEGLQKDEDLRELKDECFWSYFSPDGSRICFYAMKEYIIIYEVASGDLSWCYRLRGNSAADYSMTKPIFHPTLPMMAWVERFRKDERADFDSFKHCSVYLVDVSTQHTVPVQIPDLTVNCHSDLVFSPCGRVLYGGVISRDDYNSDELKLEFFSIDFTSSPPRPVSYIKAVSPIRSPLYCDSRSLVSCTLVLRNDEPHFLITVEYKVMLAKVNFDGTVKWKMIASLPGPPKSPEAIVLSGWNKDKEGGRLDIILAAQNIAYPSVVNTWDENSDVWDEVVRVTHNPTL